MKKYILFLFFPLVLHAQGGTWFDKKVKIGQSMETTDLQSEPAQLQLTLNKGESPSYLINAGVSVTIDPNDRFISKLKTEFHRNTVINEEQNNFEAGYQGTLRLGSNAASHLFVVFDPKYVYDGVEEKSSAAGNILFSWFDSAGKLHFNTDTYFNSDTQALFLSVYGGVQMQHAFKAKAEEAERFVLRPVGNFNISYSWGKTSVVFEPKLKLSASYTARYATINNTDMSEHYTDLLKTGIDYYFITKPVAISIGASYNYGSDPLKGLDEQQFWLLSLNVSK